MNPMMPLYLHIYNTGAMEAFKQLNLKFDLFDKMDFVNSQTFVRVCKHVSSWPNQTIPSMVKSLKCLTLLRGRETIVELWIAMTD